MLELPMAAPLANLLPAVGFEHRDHLMNLPSHMTVSAGDPQTGRRGGRHPRLHGVSKRQ
jgi:hypothetical protein